MTVVGKIEVKGFLRLCDLQDGEVFAFCDESTPYLKVDDGCNDAFVDFEDGKLYIEDNCDRPVRRINAELVIK